MFNQKIDNLFLFTTIITLLLILIAFFVFILIFMYQKRHVEYLNNIQKIKSAHENELLRSRISVQDKTFQNLSREIHDNVGQKLSLSKLQITDAIASLHLNNNAAFQTALYTLTNAITDLRDLSRSLSADYIAAHGLIKGIENEIFQLNRIGHLHFKMLVTGETRFITVENEIVVFRIFQESLNNIVKHADASNVTISVQYTEDYMELEIKDDGRGFDISQVRDSNGLTNIRKRAEFIKAPLELVSQIGKGTQITIKIPYNESSS